MLKIVVIIVGKQGEAEVLDAKQTSSSLLGKQSY